MAEIEPLIPVLEVTWEVGAAPAVPGVTSHGNSTIAAAGSVSGASAKSCPSPSVEFQ